MSKETHHIHLDTYLTPHQIKEACAISNPENLTERQVCTINQEFQQGFNLFEKYNSELEKSVTFYGSARFTLDNPTYKKIYTLARRIGEELGYAIITGGASGVMEAANHGAFDAGVPSIGLTIALSHEQSTNKYVTHEVPFDFFFTRKTLLKFSAETYIFCPGGYGTLDEFFDLLTLVQTKKIPPVPLILYGVEFWTPLVEFFKKTLIETYNTVSFDETPFVVTDNDDEILEIIKNSPIRTNDNSFA
ncbi:MAG: TIGR00730 family Rossman fold protein [Candidatus Pacebacteria bacterium]|nr:TIGR00730 family Rossman fold protein [Candidatus Paceibacterota bacterium]